MLSKGKQKQIFSCKPKHFSYTFEWQIHSNNYTMQSVAQALQQRQNTDKINKKLSSIYRIKPYVGFPSLVHLHQQHSARRSSCTSCPSTFGACNRTAPGVHRTQKKIALHPLVEQRKKKWQATAPFGTVTKSRKTHTNREHRHRNRPPQNVPSTREPKTPRRRRRNRTEPIRPATFALLISSISILFSTRAETKCSSQSGSRTSRGVTFWLLELLALACMQQSDRSRGASAVRGSWSNDVCTV